MKTWILILIVHWGYGTAITSTEFNSRESCEVAGMGFEEQAGSMSPIWYNCVEK